jgi:hypothetical protein
VAVAFADPRRGNRLEGQVEPFAGARLDAADAALGPLARLLFVGVIEVGVALAIAVTAR